MTLSVGAYEAKTKFSHLLERAASGENTIIERHGVPIARLVPIVPQRNEDELVDAFQNARRHLNLGPVSVRELIDQGRK